MRYLDADAQQIVNVEICPFPELDATSKTLARPIFSLMVLMVWIFLFFFTLAFQHVFSFHKCTVVCFCTKMFQEFSLKLVEGFVQTIKYSYSGLAKASFIFVTCTSFGDQTFWKFNAEVQCFSPLQTVVIIFTAFYTVPLVLVSPVGGKLLRARSISYIQIMFACIFPFPFIVF